MRRAVDGPNRPLVEATALGAAMVVFVGAGIYRSVDEARRAIDFGETRINPSRSATKKYTALYAACRRLAPGLVPFCRGAR